MKSKNRKELARLVKQLQAPGNEALAKLVGLVVEAYEEGRAEGYVAGAAAMNRAATRSPH